MTKQQLEKHWDLLVAQKAGETIQVLNINGEWADLQDPEYQDDITYRVKPKLREWWINLYPDIHTKGTAFQTREDADKHANNTRTECVHVREVI